MAEVLPTTPLHHLQRMLGLPTWRLRRDIADKPAIVGAAASPLETVAKIMPEPPSLPAENELAIAGRTSVEEQVAATVLAVDGHRIHVYRDLTLLEIKNYGSWWLPAVSLADGKMRLFRSSTEMVMLCAMLEAVGLLEIIGHMQNIDAFLAARQMPANRLPANVADLLSLPAPWLLCGAIAQRQAETLATAQECLSLPHPLAMLKEPQQKRIAWQRILSYKQKVHD